MLCVRTRHVIAGYGPIGGSAVGRALSVAVLGMMLIGLGLQAGPLRVGCLGEATAKGVQDGQSSGSARTGTRIGSGAQLGVSMTTPGHFRFVPSRRLKDACPPPLSKSLMELLMPLAELPVTKWRKSAKPCSLCRMLEQSGCVPPSACGLFSYIGPGLAAAILARPAFLAVRLRILAAPAGSLPAARPAVERLQARHDTVLPCS